VLPHVLRFNIVDENASRLYAELAPCLFPKMDISSNDKEVSVKFIDNLASLSKELGLEQKLRGLNIPEDACAKMASDAMKQSRLLINNPREITEKDALDIYKLAW
jgi:alcohol dehydrogenase class IV